ncbi:MAG: M23 family metallopeptidase [Chitinophagaceae bacterium]
MKVKNAFLFLPLLLAAVLLACNSTKQGFFTRKTPHENYASGLQQAGLSATRLAILWQQAAERSLAQPLKITLPFKESGYFAVDNPGAAGYQFSLRRGEKLSVGVSRRPALRNIFFIELWEALADRSPNLLVAADTAASSIEYTIQRAGIYIIRLQPELLQGVSYQLAISKGASLAFPINKNDKPSIISLWGVGRDAGVRKHEGIDILAKKRTPVLAIAPGYISSTRENNLGGKVVFLAPDNMNINLYYAHLDTTWVQANQRVRIGDTLGLTGNTGNARNTVSHLHFGIYTGSGAIDPLPFIQANKPEAKPVQSDTALLGRFVRLKNGQPGDAGSIAKILSAMENNYKIQFPDKREVIVREKDVTTQPLSSRNSGTAEAMYDMPDSTSALSAIIEPGSIFVVLGNFQGYAYCQWKQNVGWVKK